jgi:hypothetical protein
MGEGSESSSCQKSRCFISFVIRDPLSKSIDLFIIRIDSFGLDSGEQETCNCNTLMEFVQWDYDRQFRADNNIITQNQTKVSHLNASQMELTSLSDRKLLVWTIHGNTGYRVQYSAPDFRFTEYLGGFEDMLKSFPFSEQTETKEQVCILFNFICF